MIHKNWRNWLPNSSFAFIGVGVIILLAGCYDPDDDRMYPYRFEKVWEFGEQWTVADLDYMGGDEIVFRVYPREYRAKEAWQIAHADGRVIDEIAIPGVVLSPPSVADIDDDASTLEVLFPVNRGDSLFLYAYSHEAKPARPPILIVPGKKKTDSNGTVYNWEAEARFYLLDTNGDQVTEIVSVVNSTFAGLPRGIWIHDKLTGTQLGYEMTGAAFDEPMFLRDIDADGLFEIGFASGVPNHGAEFNGLSDADGHLVVIELSTDPIIEWSESVEIPRTQFFVHLGSFSSTDRHEMLAINVDRRTTSLPESRVRLYDLELVLDGQQPREMSVNARVLDTAAGDLNKDGLDEFFVLTTDNELIRYEHQAVVSRKVLDRPIRNIDVFPDLNQDGYPELILYTQDGPHKIVDRDQKVVAISYFRLTTKWIRLVSGERRLISGDGYSIRIIPNRLYLLLRYGDEGAIALSVLVAILLIAAAYRYGVTKTVQVLKDADTNEAKSVATDLFSNTSNSVKRALLVLEENFADPEFDIESWAKMTGYSGSRQLQRVVKEVTNQTPEKLLWLRRINEGERLLKEDAQLTVAEVAFEVGFKEQSHFSKKFREIKGQAPSDVRES